MQLEQNLTLSERERESISFLTLLCSNISASSLDVEQSSVGKITDQGASTLIAKDTGSKPSSKLPTKPITNTQQFLSWFADIEEEMEEGQEDSFKSYVTTLEQTRSQIVKMETQIQHVNQILDDLKFNYKLVTSKTQNLQNACEQLLDEQRHLVSVSEDIGLKMKYFQELEGISKALNQPGEELVKEASFSLLLQKLDECLDFVQTHVCGFLNRCHLDSSIYLIINASLSLGYL